MITLAMRSEFSFGKCYYPLPKIIRDSKKNGYVGIADLDNTFAHPVLEKACRKENMKPIFGVRLRGTEKSIKNRSYRKTYDTILEFIFLAKNDEGLKEIYKLVSTAYYQFYYFPRLTYLQISEVSNNVFIMCQNLPHDMSDINMALVNNRIDFSVQCDEDLDGDVAIPLVNYPKNDKDAYEVLTNAKGGDLKTYSTGNPTDQELLIRGYSQKAIDITHKIAEQCNSKISISDFVKFPANKTIEYECKLGAIRRKIDISSDGVYRERLIKEIEIINKRGFQDYFLIVSDILMWAKKSMLVGPGRGSSGGSLVCYLIGITEMDPIEHQLIFERFVDLNRIGLPDIDSDIPDVNRKKVVKYIAQLYGEQNVKTIGTITTYKPKSAIVDVAKSLLIPSYEIHDLKNAIIVRQGGDDRVDSRIIDTFNDTDVGKETLLLYPNLRIAEKIESHARNQSKHAAGVIICNEPIYNFSGINEKEQTLMMTKDEVEKYGLLKIDLLGLRTLSIIEDTAKLAGFSYKDFYKLTLDDPKVFQIFNENRTSAIFQFEGPATRNLNSQINIESFDDICSLCALSRPGALISGEAARFVKRKNGEENPTYYGDVYKIITEVTLGSVIYQEQGMALMKDYAGMSWGSINPLRKGISKSAGQEFFEKYKKEFMDGCEKNGHNIEESSKIWDIIASMGSYSFNKSHAVAYSIISYWTAWCKAYHPLEFAAANLNHTKDEDNAIKVLRDFVTHDKIKYVPVDPDTSDVNWSIRNGVLVGGLTNVDGIGITKAKQIIKMRDTQQGFTPSAVLKMINHVTPYDILFPAHHHFKEYYENPSAVGLTRKISDISDLNNPANYIVIGKVIVKDLRFRNEAQLVRKRGNQVTSDLYFLKLIIEDDTSDIMCNIPPFKMDELHGRSLSETLEEGKTWVIINGDLGSKFRSLTINSIMRLPEPKK